MKTLTFLMMTLLVANSYAQTTVIAVKSQHGSAFEIQHSTDNFGLVSPSPDYDSIIRLSGDCVVQIGTKYLGSRKHSVRFRDTVCNHWYYKEVNFDKNAILEFHGEHVVMIGFKETDNYRKEDSPFFNKRSSKQSSKWMVIILLLAGLGTYLLRPTWISQKKS